VDNQGLVVFQDKKIRRLFIEGDWYYSVTDIVAILTESRDELAYWRKLKEREPQLVTICHGFKLAAKDGKMRFADCVSTKGAFRLVQSIPSPKAEPFKLWLAQVGYERVQEIENPELAQTRMREIYRAKGYSDDWIEKRVRGIAIRDELTDEWKTRGVKLEKEYALLTAEISKATFGMTPQEYKQFKGLKNQNLRDHMDDLELIFSMLGERVTTEITRKEDAQGYPQAEGAAKRGGRVAGNARKETEHELGRPVTTKENFLDSPEKEKRKRIK
jgi:hypothetical protein